MFLVDTSAWILHFSKASAFDLRDHCPPEERVLCLPVYQEILQGIRDEATFRSVRSILRSASFVESPLTARVYDEAIILYRLARRRGVTIRSSVDCLIAACAMRHDLAVIHANRDFAALASVSALKELDVAGRG
jgi:predicted nucleic acid-binding protein